MNLQLFFERLKAERIRRGLNQDEMAEKVGVSKRSYCAYEAGDTAPSATKKSGNWLVADTKRKAYAAKPPMKHKAIFVVVACLVALAGFGPSGRQRPDRWWRRSRRSRLKPTPWLHGKPP